jgi:type II secretory pathway component GspD/PulD (secretin)
LIQGLDRQSQQVAITCLIADVRLTNTEEFGVEIGLQSPILFTRSLIGTTGTVGLTNTTGSLIPAGTSVTQATNITAVPGLNFNTTQAINGGLPQYNLASPSTVAFQGLGNLGVGRTNSNGLGGFVFSGASDTVNILVRALKTQGRIDILNAPTLQVLDNQVGVVSVGQIFPYVTGGQFTALGTFQPNITYRTDVGVTLQITPRISPEGRILMRVEPSIIQPLDTQINLGNGLFATAFSNQTVQTTVLADDGETVVIGGLISKQSTKNENKIPFFGDLPYVGALFRYRTQAQEKREVIVVLTPRIIRAPEDADRYALDRMKLMDWDLKGIEKTYGRENMDLILPKGGNGDPSAACPAPDGVGAPANILPPDMLPSPAPAPAAKTPAVVPAGPSITPVGAKEDVKKKETRGWSLFGSSK